MKKCTKRKHDTDIGPLIKEKTLNGTEWEEEEEKIQQDFLLAVGPEARHQITRYEYRTEPDNFKIDKFFKLYNRYYIPKGNKYNSRGEFFWAKQTDTETPDDHWEKLIEREKACNFPDFSTELPKSKLITSITHRKSRNNLLKEKELDVPKVVEQMQQKTHDKHNKTSNTPAILISNREQEIKEEPIHKITCTGKCGTRPKERPKEQTADIAMHQIEILIKSVHPEKQYAIIAKKVTSQKFTDRNTTINRK